ncbi:hypothetical protein PM082_019939 [Marasmius tenuissimus]|nr:hypothetical protein PM082_019939 [Marasmius tenuissimus]
MKPPSIHFTLPSNNQTRLDKWKVLQFESNTRISGSTRPPSCEPKAPNMDTFTVKRSLRSGQLRLGLVLLASNSFGFAYICSTLDSLTILLVTGCTSHGTLSM